MWCNGGIEKERLLGEIKLNFDTVQHKMLEIYPSVPK